MPQRAQPQECRAQCQITGALAVIKCVLNEGKRVGRPRVTSVNMPANWLHATAFEDGVNQNACVLEITESRMSKYAQGLTGGLTKPGLKGFGAVSTSWARGIFQSSKSDIAHLRP